MLQVGPDMCPLAREKGEKPSEIKDRLEGFIDSLYYKPLPVPNAAVPGLLTSGRVRST